MPTAEYVRRAVASFDAGLTPGEVDQLTALAAEVDAASRRMTAMIDRAVTAVDRPFDDDGVRRTVAARLAAAPVDLDPARLDFGRGAAA